MMRYLLVCVLLCSCVKKTRKERMNRCVYEQQHTVLQCAKEAADRLPNVVPPTR